MDDIINKKTAFKLNNCSMSRGLNRSNDDDIFDNAIISADERLGGNRLSIKETLIWIEESRVVFYKIKKQLELDNEKISGK